MALPYCVCCRTRPGLPTHPRGRKELLPLCPDCFEGGHRLEACLLCPSFLLRWQCSWVAHFAAEHPELLQKLANDPFPELVPPAPTLRYLGRIPVPKGT